MKQQGKHLNCKRYSAEGAAAYKAGVSLPDPFFPMEPDPCPYTRWWKVDAWWRGFMTARSKELAKSWDCFMSKDFKFQTNTYEGVQR